MKKIQCLDTTESRILFGLLRKVYNTTLLSSDISLPISDSLVNDTKMIAKFAKYQAIRNNTEIRLSRKKRGNLPSLFKERTTIIVKDGKVNFKVKKNQKSFEITLQDSKDLRDGIYTEAFIHWEQKTPFLTVDEKKVRFDRPAISLKNTKVLLKSRLKSEKEVHDYKLIKSRKKLLEIRREFSEDSNELKEGKIEFLRNVSEIRNKIKFNLYKYIEGMNLKYSSFKVEGSLFAGENQASTEKLILKDNMETIIYDLFYSEDFSQEENKFLIDILKINSKNF